MNVLKIILLFIIVISLISGCKMMDTTEKTYVQGYSLKEIGLDFKVNYEVQILDPNDPKFKPGYFTSNSDLPIPMTIIHEKENYKLYGNFTIIELSFSDGHLDANQLPLKYVQGFRKQDIKNNHLVELNDKSYSFQDLKKNKIYEDDNWVIYELSDYLDVLDIDSKIKIISDNSSSSYDFNWFKEADAYLDEHLPEMIAK